MTQLFANAARTALAADISAVDTTITITPGTGGLFPVANTGTSNVGSTIVANWYRVVIDNGTAIEIVYVRTHTAAADTFSNVVRGMDGTTALAWTAGAAIGLRVTAGDMARRHALRVYRAFENQSIVANSSFQKIVFNTVDFDTGGIWLSGPFSARPKIPGFYLVWTHVKLTTPAKLELSIYKNGGPVARIGGVRDDALGISSGGSGLVYCDGQSDYIESFVYANNAVTELDAVSGQIHTYMNILGPM